MYAEAFALDFKFGKAVLGKEREEIAQLFHGKLLVGLARLVRLVASASSAITVALTAACPLRLFG
jgi:hypothetical protein